MTLNDLALFKNAKIKSLNCSGSIRRRLLDLGLISGTSITPILISPSGDPRAFVVRGSVIAIRKEDCSQIDISI